MRAWDVLEVENRTGNTSRADVDVCHLNYWYNTTDKNTTYDIQFLNEKEESLLSIPLALRPSLSLHALLELNPSPSAQRRLLHNLLDMEQASFLPLALDGESSFFFVMNKL